MEGHMRFTVRVAGFNCTFHEFHARLTYSSCGACILEGNVQFMYSSSNARIMECHVTLIHFSILQPSSVSIDHLIVGAVHQASNKNVRTVPPNSFVDQQMHLTA